MMDHIKKKREEKKKKMKATRASEITSKKNEKADFTVAFSGQGETMEENIHQKSTRKSKETY